jgi:hypothetical protein
LTYTWVGVNTHLGRVNKHLGRVTHTWVGLTYTWVGVNTQLGRVNTHQGAVVGVVGPWPRVTQQVALHYAPRQILVHHPLRRPTRLLNLTGTCGSTAQHASRQQKHLYVSLEHLQAQRHGPATVARASQQLQLASHSPARVRGWGQPHVGQGSCGEQSGLNASVGDGSAATSTPRGSRARSV